MSQEQNKPGTERRRFRPYPEYKDSSVEWLGKIPEHWEIKRLRLLSEICGGGTPSKDVIDYWNGDIPWVSPKDMKVSVIIDTIDKISEHAVSESATKLIPAGAVLLVVRSGILIHSIPVALTGRAVTLNQDLKALIPRSEIIPEYLFYYVRGMQKVLLVEWKKEGATVESLEIDLVMQTPVFLPSRKEQRAIVVFLDRETAKIDALIEKKERLIELLKEKRAALITQAVTKGLDLNVPMKDSGIEWLGKIPAHWVVFRLKFVATMIMGQSPSSEAYTLDELCMPFLQGNAEFGAIHPSPKYYCDEAAKVVPTGSLLISVRAPVGALNIADRLIGIGRGLCAVVAHRLHLLPEYAWHALTITRNELLSIATGSTYEAVSADEVAAVKSPIPPVDEQRIIASFLDRETAKIDALILKIQEAIDKLKEYRTALISAAVTGKIDVRAG